MHNIPAGRSGVGKPWSGVGSPALDILGLKQVLDTDKDWNFRTVHAAHTQLAHRKCMVNINTPSLHKRQEFNLLPNQHFTIKQLRLERYFEFRHILGRLGAARLGATQLLCKGGVLHPLS